MKKNKCFHIGTSAKSGTGIEDAFKQIVEKIESSHVTASFYRERGKTHRLTKDINVKATDKKKKKKKCC